MPEMLAAFERERYPWASLCPYWDAGEETLNHEIFPPEHSSGAAVEYG